MFIRIDPASLQRSQAGTISGVVHLEWEGFAFPEENWNDLPVVVLGQWLGEYHKLATGVSNVVRCSFMDGPFAFELRREEEGVAVRCLRRQQRTERLEREFVAPQEAVERGFLEAATEVIALCRRRGWESADISSLARLQADLAK